jgi:cyanophycinase-like exopeptidase
LSGPVALLGADRFVPATEPLDRELLAGTGKARPRVVLLPTGGSSERGVDWLDWTTVVMHHFEAIGAEVEPLLISDRADADDPASAQAVGEADLIMVSGARPGAVLDVLWGSRTWEAARLAHQRGAALVACLAGAMVLGDRCLEVRRHLGWPVRWERAFGLVRGAVIAPRYDRMPEPLMAFFMLQAPADVAVLGIDERAALVGRNGAWQVRGEGRVTVWRGRRRNRHRPGDVLRV